MTATGPIACDWCGMAIEMLEGQKWVSAKRRIVHCEASEDGCHEPACAHRWDALRSIPPSWQCRDCREITYERPRR